MTARIIDGRAIAAAVWSETRERAEALRTRMGRAPRLAVVRVGDDPSSGSYLRQIIRSFATAGLEVVDTPLNVETSQSELEGELRKISADPEADGILLQAPLPKGLVFERAVEQVAVERDVEGMHPTNAGLLAQGRPRFVPSTPLAGLEILRREGVELKGKRVTIVGRSRVVGLPLALLTIQAHGTVTVCHTRTVDLVEATRSAEVLLVAAGRAALVDGSMIRPQAIVVDFGTSYVGDKLVGDVDFESAREVAGAITPVPGGVGPVTAAMLGRNLVVAAESQA
jgi:methylenetetrahydrofolate dehydrogenase (NADP+) / methenyltetrahydrofolate cyclohydrolase